jgi:hypothetical protein
MLIAVAWSSPYNHCAGGWHNYLRHHRQGQHGACVHNVRRHRDERNLRPVGTQAREGRGCSRGVLLWRLPHHRCVRPPHREHHWESTVRHRTWMLALLQFMHTHRAMCPNHHYSGAFLIIVAFDHLIVSTIGRAQYVIARGCLLSCNSCIPTAQCAPTTTTLAPSSSSLRSTTSSSAPLIGRAQYVIARGCLLSCNSCVPTAQCGTTTTSSHHQSRCLRSCTQSRMRAYTRSRTYLFTASNIHIHMMTKVTRSHTCTIHHPIHIHVVTLVMNTDWNDAETRFGGLSTACLRV